MYDVDGNGVIDIQEMTKIVQVQTFIDMLYRYKTHRGPPYYYLTVKTLMYLFMFCFYLYFKGGY